MRGPGTDSDGWPFASLITVNRIGTPEDVSLCCQDGGAVDARTGCISEPASITPTPVRCWFREGVSGVPLAQRVRRASPGDESQARF